MTLKIISNLFISLFCVWVLWSKHAVRDNSLFAQGENKLECHLRSFVNKWRVTDPNTKRIFQQKPGFMNSPLRKKFPRHTTATDLSQARGEFLLLCFSLDIKSPKSSQDIKSNLPPAAWEPLINSEAAQSARRRQQGGPERGSDMN